MENNVGSANNLIVLQIVMPSGPGPATFEQWLKKLIQNVRRFAVFNFLVWRYSYLYSVLGENSFLVISDPNQAAKNMSGKAVDRAIIWHAVYRYGASKARPALTAIKEPFWSRIVSFFDNPNPTAVNWAKRRKNYFRSFRDILKTFWPFALTNYLLKCHILLRGRAQGTLKSTVSLQAVYC